jgi:serine/threonine-protein kinase
MGDNSPHGEPIPAALKLLTLRCLAKEPEKRPQSMGEVEQELSAIAKGTATVPTQDELDAFTKSSKARRNKTPLVAAAAVVAIALAAGGYVVLRPAPAPVAAPVPAAKAPSSVNLAVASNPSGAKVIRADTGAVLGRTPMVTSLPYLEQDVELSFELDGHEKLSRSIRPTKDLSLEVVLSAVARAPSADEEDPPAKVKRSGKGTRTQKTRPARSQEKVSDDDIIDPFAM